MKRKSLLIFLDIIFVTVSFLLVARILPGKWSRIIPDYHYGFLIFVVIWVSISLIIKKYNFSRIVTPSSIINRVLISNFAVAAVVSILFYGLNIYSYSRSLVFGVIILSTGFEFVLFYFINAIFTSLPVEIENGDFMPDAATINRPKQVSLKTKESTTEASPLTKGNLYGVFKLILEENGREVHDLIYSYVKVTKHNVRIVSTTTRFNIYSLEKDKYGCIVNLQRINDIQRINKFFEAVNAKLFEGAFFIGKAETYVLRKARILRRFPWPLNYFYYTLDFVIKRIWPKVPLLNKIYFFLTHGYNRVISRAETLGRLYSCGFEVVEEKFLNDELYFVVRKVKVPLFPEDPTYGPLIKLQRIGKNGKAFTVFKMRTMHAYAEYLQEYVYELNKLQPGGKIKDDFRVTTIGKFMRKVWLDELPMLLNVLRGEMKIVGIRPLSNHYFNLYSDELKQRRIKHKPGMIPPFYVDMPVTLEEIMDSEMRYLDQYEKSPFLTDCRYFFKAMKNILVKHARSN